ncbi:MAG: aminoglycoside phosphotransferase family protein [Bacteroidetes bacterium]|nr:aminoglycoside phosphotransferase family protein [Bacteroidota bacterium]
MTAQSKQPGNDFATIIAQFNIEGKVAQVEPYGSGHIHDTFRVINQEHEHPDYLLQRINHHVFKNIPALMANLQKVTSHLRQKLEAMPGAEPDQEVLRLVLSKAKQAYYQDEKGNFWRMYYFLKGTRSYDIVETRQQAYEGGKAFGRFQALLSDLDASSLAETIPDFHDAAHRLRLFHEAVQRNPKGRVREVAAEISFVEERAEAMSTISRLGRLGELPLRITHNDTKFNNVLLNSSDKAQCIIDLDTVMPGYVAYDFGDAVRTIINTAPEDEKDLNKIKLNFDLFEGFTEGFLKETAAFLTDQEIKSLPQGVLLLPFIMGLRFLTDYIDGDHYYKIQFPEHNIQRARAQFKLVAILEKQYSLVAKIVQKIAKASKEAAVEDRPGK